MGQAMFSGMKNKTTVWMVRSGFVVALGFLVLGCETLEKIDDAAGEHHWKFSTWGKPRPFTAGIDALSDYVKAKSGGKFTITVYYGNALVNSKENLQAVGDGVVEMANYCTAYHPAKTPGTWALDLPFLPLDDLETQRRVYEAIHMRPEIRNEFQRRGVQYVFTALLPHYELMGVGNPPESIEGYRGRSIRALGPMRTALKRLGAKAITVPSSGVYDALSDGTIDAVAFPYTFTFKAYKTYEIGHWFTSDLVLGAIHCPVVVNEAAYKALPGPFKRLIEEAKQVAYRDMIEAYTSRDESNLSLFRRYDLKRVAYSADQRLRFIREAGAPVWKSWIEDNEHRSFSPHELVQAILQEALAEKPPSFRNGVMQIYERMAAQDRSVAKR